MGASTEPSGGPCLKGTATVTPERVGLLEPRTWEVRLALEEDLPAESIVYFSFAGMQRQVATLQNGAAGEDGYWEIDAPGVEFEAGWAQLSAYEVVRVVLKTAAPAGTRLTFRVVDVPHRREKAMGLRVHAWDRRPFPVFVKKPGDERLYEVEKQPAADVEPGDTHDVRAYAPSTVAGEEVLPVKVVFLDRELNPVERREAELTKVCDCGRHPFRAERVEGMLTGYVPVCDCDEIVVEDADSYLTCTLNPRRRVQGGDLRLFWGEIHSHGHFDDGARDLDYNFRFASETACLDFAAASIRDHFADMAAGVLTQYSNAMWPFAEAFGFDWEDEFRALSDHLLGVPEGRTRWEHALAKTERYNQPGRFVTLAGYEWAASKYPHLEKADGIENIYGHRCLYFNLADPPLLSSRSERTSTPEGLFAALRPHAGRVIAIPHHPAAHPEYATGGWTMNWRRINPDFDRLVEVFSCHGNSEYPGNPKPIPGKCGPAESFVRSAIARGIKVGIVAGTDNHEARPGQVDGGWGNSPGGMIGVWATELTRDAIFDALYNRRCYGVSNMSRMVLDFRLAGEPMGSELALRPYRKRELAISVLGTAHIEDVQIIKNGSPWRAFKSPGSRFEHIEVDDEPAVMTDSYYVTVLQRDGEMAWSSPIWVQPEGAQA